MDRSQLRSRYERLAAGDQDSPTTVGQLVERWPRHCRETYQLLDSDNLYYRQRFNDSEIGYVEKTIQKTLDIEVS